MNETKKDNINIFIIGVVSSLIGGLIVYYLLKNKMSSPQAVPSLHPSVYLDAQGKYNEILEEKLINIESQLHEMKQIKLNSLQEQIPPPTQSSTQPSTQLSNPLINNNNNSNNNNNTLYKNNESWEIFRGKDGFISKLNVLRDVKTNN